MKTQTEMEAIMNLTYPGLRLLYRDTNLRAAAAKYEAGMLLRSPVDVDASLLGGGLLAPHRYAIFSNRFLDASEQPDGADRAHCILEKTAYFKVLDMHKRLGKAQITLLHLPRAHWQFFEDVSTNVDDLLVAYARKRFDACLEREPLAVLDVPEWRQRCCHLVGMTDLGVLYPVAD